jgi:hypothetical protein
MQYKSEAALTPKVTKIPHGSAPKYSPGEQKIHLKSFAISNLAKVTTIGQQNSPVGTTCLKDALGRSCL